MLIAVLLPRLVWSQTTPVMARVDRNTVALNQTVNFIISVDGGNSVRPTLPAIDGVDLVGTSSATQTNIVGGQINSQVSYRYTLQPTREGEVTIPPIPIIVDGQTYTTDPILVQVTAMAAPPQSSGGAEQNAPLPSAAANRDVFIEAEIDNPNPYLGEQITYIFRLYQAVSLFDTPDYQSPNFVGFWNQRLHDQKTYSQTIDNRGYLVTELRTLLFPTVIGTQTIEPAGLIIPNSLFQRGMSLQTSPVQVNVRPLPEPIPDGFSGAVGQLKLSASVQTESSSTGNSLTVQVDEPVTLRAVLEGTGNFETFKEVPLPNLEDWRAFDSTSQLDTRVADNILHGEINLEQLLVPTQPGDYEISAISYVYFDPKLASYQTAATMPILIKVEGEATSSSSLQSSSAGASLSLPNSVQTLDADIRYIKAAPVALAQGVAPLTQRPLFWLLWLIPLALLVGDWQLRQRQGRLEANPVAARRSRALQQAQQDLRKAKASSEDPATVASQILIDYLSDKLDLSVSGLTQRELAERLHELDVGRDLIDRVARLQAFSEMSRYAPGQEKANPQAVWEEIASLLNGLERILA